MGQIGLQELIIVFIVALLVFGPKKLPELGKSLGKGIKEFKKATEDLKSSWDDHIREVEDPIKETTREIHRDLQETAHAVTAEPHPSEEPAPQIASESHETSHPTEAAVPGEKEKV